jgi:hypothetical protein
MKLMSLFALLFFFPYLHAQDVLEQIKESQAVWKRWQELQKRELRSRDLYAGQSERSSLIVEGIPKFVKEVDPTPVVYRHYISGSALPIILSSSQLKAGITPYVIMNPGFSKEVYQDLVGIFLTSPSTPPERIGLARNPHMDYIDFSLFKGTPVVQIEKEILLIPGRADLPQWIKELYAEYKKTGRAEARYMDDFRRYDESGAGNPTYMKIQIKSYRMNGKVVHLSL